MKFRTEIKVKPLGFEIGYNDTILSLGSCFATSIADHLRELRFDIRTNPSGILFNPQSIADAVKMFITANPLQDSDLELSNGLYFNYSFHGSFSDHERKIALRRMNHSIEYGADSLSRSSVVIVTFGTAWAYSRKGEVVANCHKQPAEEFTRQLLTTEQIVDCWSKLIDGELRNKRIIFTLSPVRHLRDDATENSLSKAILRVAINSLTERYDNAYYFPAYELMMDDLRDYRFYAEDMTHPSKVAVEYICEKFDSAAMSAPTIELTKQVRSIVSGLCHTPLHGSSPQHEQFKEQLRSRAEELTRLYGIDFSL